MKSYALSLALVALLALPVTAGDDASPGLDPLVETMLKTGDRKVQADLVDEILALEPKPDVLAEKLRAGHEYAAGLPTGWLERENVCLDGVARNYLLYVPEDYTPEKRYRLVLDMHGGVSRPEQLSHADLEQMKFFWGDHAKEHGYFLALPAGQKRAEWWTPVGAHNALEVIRTVKREYNIDENRVVATGFSDGASGTFYMALTHSTPFAAFIPLNGHLAVTQAGGLQTHLLNLLNKPLYIVNTEKDSLYPSSSVKPIIDALEPLGVHLVWRDIPEYTHNPMYMPEERPAIWTWLKDLERQPHPKRVVWQGAGMAPRRVHWLNVTHIDGGEGAGQGDASFDDPNPEMGPGRVLIGVTIDQAYQGPGVRIETVSEDTPAEEIGVEEGDVIVGLDDTKIAGLPDLRRVLGGKTWGDTFTVDLERGEETLHLEGEFPEAQPRPMFRRPLTASAVDASYADNRFDVKAARVKSFDLLLSSKMVDLAKPVVVTVNGKTVHEGIVKPDAAFMLNQAARDEDRHLVYEAHLRITVPNP